ncbi:MAG: UbiA family prenyltransferase [Candidatus Poribacteria bacterium]|nr:UbiA family prenyltransferase [Candidatus Poribacteria bacterium]MDE0503386.1 UbiA family prenyltransferase [Candidatus Poribacteria bacterium]
MEKQSHARTGRHNQFLCSVLPICDYLIVLRPTLLFPVWTLVLLGHFHGTAHYSHSFQIEFLGAEIPVQFDLDTRVWVSLCLYSMLAGAGYIINQIADKESDSANDKLYLVADGYVNLTLIKLEAAVLFIASIVWAVVWFYRSWAYLALIAVSAVLGVIYSVRPIRLKGIPVLDLLANAIGYGGVAFLLGWTATATLNLEVLQRAIPYVFCVAAAFVNTTLPDVKGDSAQGDRTTGVLLGTRRACLLSILLLVIAILSAWLVKDAVALIAASVSVPFFVYMNVKPNRRAIVLATRIGILALTLITCILFPIYFVLFGGTLLFVRWYYAARFGIVYPGSEA